MNVKSGKQLLAVTGLTGKSGITFARLLGESPLAERYDIRACVRPTPNTEALRSALPWAELCVGDLEGAEYPRELTRDADVLFHISGIGKSVPLVKAALENGVKRLVLVHTTGIFSKYKAAGEHYRRIDKEATDLCAENGAGLDDSAPHHDLRHLGGPEHRQIHPDGG